MGTGEHKIISFALLGLLPAELWPGSELLLPIPSLLHTCSFPMPKDSLLHARLQQEGLGRTFRPTHPDAATLCLAHDPGYVHSFLDGSISPAAMRRIGLPWSPALVQRTLIGVGSAILASRLALQLGVAVMCNGGTHHAHHSHGSGEEGLVIVLNIAAGRSWGDACVAAVAWLMSRLAKTPTRCAHRLVHIQ